MKRPTLRTGSRSVHRLKTSLLLVNYYAFIDHFEFTETLRAAQKVIDLTDSLSKQREEICDILATAADLEAKLIASNEKYSLVYVRISRH